MSRKSYSPEEISLISSCPYVESSTPKTVRYAAEFMGIFWRKLWPGNTEATYSGTTACRSMP